MSGDVWKYEQRNLEASKKILYSRKADMEIDIFTEAEHQNRMNTAAGDMFFLVKDTLVDGQITEQGLKRIGDRFGKVEESDRAEVYIKFINILDTYGVKYDANQFGRTAI